MGESELQIPRLNSPIIETHCHLDYLKLASPEDTVAKCKLHGISKLITISVEPANLATVLQIATDFDGVYCSQGIHPHHANQYNDKVGSTISANLASSAVVAVGEIGLDYYYTRSPKEEQIKAFHSQIELALEQDLPIIIHSREAEEDTIKVLSDYQNLRGVLHSFTSKSELAEFAIERGFYLGFNGIITFKNAKEVREIVKSTPLENILLETDSPFLTPVPYRGRENAPYFLPFVARKIAEIKEVEVEQVLKSAFENSLALFKGLD